ncbi:hypothetical protein F4775DRAFT_542233 [Biscogniauxia sp. FL1348]|nr:hypothetical protein F4775DRAFT_542233 [Biscogniauxia sp. FL1348]
MYSFLLPASCAITGMLFIAPYAVVVGMSPARRYMYTHELSRAAEPSPRDVLLDFLNPDTNIPEARTSPTIPLVSVRGCRSSRSPPGKPRPSKPSHLVPSLSSLPTYLFLSSLSSCFTDRGGWLEVTGLRSIAIAAAFLSSRATFG